MIKDAFMFYEAMVVVETDGWNTNENLGMRLMLNGRLLVVHPDRAMAVSEWIDGIKRNFSRELIGLRFRFDPDPQQSFNVCGHHETMLRAEETWEEDGEIHRRDILTETVPTGRKIVLDAS